MARKATYDQEKVKELRMSLVLAGLAIMKGDKRVEKWSDYKKEFIMKTAIRAIPQLTEISGKDGEAIEIKGVDILIRK